MLTVGDRFPFFSLTAVTSADPKTGFELVTNDTYAGNWLVVFFWPKDFTFICPTEIIGFGALEADFADRGAILIGASIDSEFVHAAWRQHHPDLTPLRFPWLSDLKRELSSALGILDRDAGVPLRATFIVDPQGLIRSVQVNDLSVGRNPMETLRSLDALQTGELCPCNWQQGENTLNP